MSSIWRHYVRLAWGCFLDSWQQQISVAYKFKNIVSSEVFHSDLHNSTLFWHKDLKFPMRWALQVYWLKFQEIFEGNTACYLSYLYIFHFEYMITLADFFLHPSHIPYWSPICRDHPNKGPPIRLCQGYHLSNCLVIEGASWTKAKREQSNRIEPLVS